MAAEGVGHVVGAGGEENKADLVVDFPHRQGGIDAGHSSQVNVHEYGDVEVGPEIGEEAFGAGEGADGKLLPVDGGILPDLALQRLPLLGKVVHNSNIHYNMSPLSSSGQARGDFSE